MNIYYTNETLYVNIDEILDEAGFIKLKKRLYRILEDYGIYNVILNISSKYDNKLLNNLLNESSKKYQANIKIM